VRSVPARRAAVVAIAVLLPVLLAGNGIYALLHPWFVRFEYGRSGFPPDAYGMARAERTRLADAGLSSILPWDRDGIDGLRRARLADGSPAFDRHELDHMTDVRRLLLVLLALHAVALFALVALAARAPTRPLARAAVRGGVAFTLGLAVLVGALLAVNEDWFLTGFHTIFFGSGTSWRFADHETLRRLYPDRFWHDTALYLGVFAAAQAVALLALTWRRDAANEEPAEAGSSSERQRE
jgi:integral membrane protein (TIGR01906 family)